MKKSVDGKRKYYLFLIVHFIPLIVLMMICLGSLSDASYGIYTIFSITFIANVIFSLSTVLKYSKGAFYYLLSIILCLGFFVKFSFHSIFKYDYLEPIGYFQHNSDSFNRVLIVSIIGGLGVLVAQLISFKLYNKNVVINDSHDGENSKLAFIVISILIVVMSFLNIKYNIMLFGHVPKINLPLKGNFIFFLFLTRGLIFLLFYYCFRKKSIFYTLFGGVLVATCSIGVLSRMLVLLYFSALFLDFLMASKYMKISRLFCRGLFLVSSFLIISLITVNISTYFRAYLGQNNKDVLAHSVEKLFNNESSESVLSSQELNAKLNSKSLESKSYFSKYMEMVVDRWIGMEGVMSVEGYKDKGFPLLVDALFEKSYKGHSFYTKISHPENYKNYRADSKLITTSVPGPIAFAYYSNSLIVVFAFLLFSTLLFDYGTHWMERFFNGHKLAVIYVSVFMVFDFFQFGISPLSFVKNWGFSFVCLLVFLHRSKIRLLFTKNNPL